MRLAASLDAIIHAGGFALSYLVYFLTAFHLSFLPPVPLRACLSILETPAVVVGENVSEDAPGNGFGGVLWNARIVYEFLFVAQVYNVPPVQYKIFKVQLCERHVAASRSPSMLNRKCRHLSSDYKRE